MAIYEEVIPGLTIRDNVCSHKYPRQEVRNQVSWDPLLKLEPAIEFGRKWYVVKLATVTSAGFPIEDIIK